MYLWDFDTLIHHMLFIQFNSRSVPQMELESVHVSDIVEVKAVPNSGVFSSLLTISVQNPGKRHTTVFMFQCEDVKVTTSCRRPYWTGGSQS